MAVTLEGTAFLTEYSECHLGKFPYGCKIILDKNIDWEKNCIPPNFLEKIILSSRIWRKSVFRVWQLSKLVPIKKLVSSITELHTPCQTLGLTTVSKEQRLFKSVTRLNPVFQPILTITIVTVNMGWNTGFSSATDLNKGCSLLTMLKLDVWQGVCSSVRLDTDIFIVTSLLNCQTLKHFFSKF